MNRVTAIQEEDLLLGLEENTDLIYQIGLWSSIAIVIAISLLMVFVIILRGRLIYTRYRQNKFLSNWQPLLRSTAEAEIPKQIPSIGKANRFLFFAIWIQCYEKNIGNEVALDRLRTLFIKAGMRSNARAMIRVMNTRNRLAAVIALGYLHDISEWDELHRIASSPDPFISLVAAHALSHINETKATPIFIQLIEKHPDWPTTKIANILHEFGAERISEPLVQMVLSASSERQDSLIPFLAACKKEIAQPIIHNLLKENKDDLLIAPCLRVLGGFLDVEDLPTIRTYLNHPRWHIRAQAAVCLGKMGNDNDEQPLLKLLKDKQWWVRYRAAQALAKLPTMNRQKLLAYKNSLDDKYGQDILTQV